MGVNLHDLRVGNGYLDVTQKAQATTTTKIDKLHVIKIKINFYASMYIIMKMKRQCTG